MSTNIHHNVRQGARWRSHTGALWAYLLVALLAAAVYWQARSFSLDKFDEDVILGNNIEYLTKRATVIDVLKRDAFFDSPGRSFYRPVQNLSYLLDARVGGGKAAIFYLDNILLHALACCLLLALLRQLLVQHPAALFGALIFAVNPLFAQAVAWTPGRGDLLLAVFCLTAALAHRAYLTSGRLGWLGATFIAVLLATLSKESGVMLTVLLPLAAALAPSADTSTNRRILLSLLVPLLASSILLVLRYVFIPERAANGQFSVMNLIDNLRVFPELVAKFFVPTLLQPLAGYTLVATAAGLLLLALLYSAAAHRRSVEVRNLAMVGLLWYIVLTLPGALFSHASGGLAYDYLEHRAYAPSIGIVMLVSLAMGRLRPNLLLIVGSVAAVTYGSLALRHTTDFRTARSFYDRAVESNPTSGFARTARAQLRAHDGNIQGAENDLRRVITEYPKFALAQAALGQIYLNNDRPDESIAPLRAALELDPTQTTYAALLGKAYRRTRNIDSAYIWYGVVFERDPSSFDAALNLGSIDAYRRNWPRALELLTRASELNPESAVAWFNRGIAHSELGDAYQSCECWQRASNLGSSQASEYLDRNCRSTPPRR